MSNDPTMLVNQALLAAGIVPSEEEVAALVAATPARQEAVEKLYAVAEARYEEPCLVFNASFPG
jgi:hypothetical protein